MHSSVFQLLNYARYCFFVVIQIIKKKYGDSIKRKMIIAVVACVCVKAALGGVLFGFGLISLGAFGTCLVFLGFF